MGVTIDEKLKDIKIDNIYDLILCVSEINEDIREQNKTRKSDEQEKELNLNYILNRYEKIKRKDEIKEFRELHECKYCLYFEKPRKCLAINRCPLDEGELWKLEGKKKNYLKCPKYDKNQPCLYANEVGTCFGFCALDILREIKKHKAGDNGEK